MGKGIIIIMHMQIRGSGKITDNMHVPIPSLCYTSFLLLRMGVALIPSLCYHQFVCSFSYSLMAEVSCSAICSYSRLARKLVIGWKFEYSKNVP